tara:strand:+ start:2051 stop:2323 length:273 start_codon:yes stop_codon:yes gene_type:complete
MSIPFKFPLNEQRELFPDLKHDSTYGYDDDEVMTDWENDSRLMTSEYIRYYEYYDSDGKRRIKKVTEKRTYFDTTDARHNPASSYTTEIL